MDCTHLVEEVRQQQRLCNLLIDGQKEWEANKPRLAALTAEKRDLEATVGQMESNV